MKHLKTLIFLGLSIVMLSSCGDDTFTPKPKGYFRIDLPEKTFHSLEKDCPFTFEVADYARVVPSPKNLDKTCWFNIEYPTLNATIYISYIATNDSLLPINLEDSRTLAFKHTLKAIDIVQKPIIYPNKKVYGLVYEIEGNAASSYQFHLTDSVNHFIRGSLYFNNVPNQDSIKPVLDFVKQDIEHIYETFEWK